MSTQEQLERLKAELQGRIESSTTELSAKAAELGGNLDDASLNLARQVEEGITPLRQEANRLTDEIRAAKTDMLAQVNKTFAAIVAEPTEPDPPQPAGGKLIYAAITDREIRPKPPAPKLGPAGSIITEPFNGNRILRVTDENTRAPEQVGKTFHTPSSVHPCSWSADGKAFIMTSSGGSIIAFDFDPAALKATLIKMPRSVVPLTGEPTFSFTEPNILYGGTTGRVYKLVRYNIRTGQMTDIIDLQKTVDYTLAEPRTYIGGYGVDYYGERMFCFFGGTGQGKHENLIIVNPENPADWCILNTRKSVWRFPDGRTEPTSMPLAFGIHACNMDKSGRFIKLTASTLDNFGAAPVVDLQTGDMKKITRSGGGHDAYSFGWRVNHAATEGAAYDASQWQLRKLEDLDNPQPLIIPQLTPKAVYVSDHASWNSVRPDMPLPPLVSGQYRYSGAVHPWRPWDDELVGIQTDVPRGTGATVWRFGHHYSDPIHTSDPTKNFFWYFPRPQLSRDGRFVLWTSNWDKTLGDYRGTPEPGGAKRADVFLMELKTK